MVTITIITVWSFLFSCLSPEYRAWAARTPAELTSVGSARTDGPGIYKELNVETFTIPEYLGFVKDAWKGSPPQVPDDQRRITIIHIQDAHCNYQAQQKISQIISYLNKEYGVSIINLEGGTKNYDLSMFTRIADPNVREKVADNFVREGLVSGAEYYAIINPDRVTLWGIEDVSLYVENLNVYRDSLKYKEKIDEYLKSLNHILSNLKSRIYSRELFDFDSKYVQYKSGAVDFKDYLTYLIQKSKERLIDIKRYTNIYLLSQTLEQEGKIDFKKANAERDILVDRLQKKLSKNALEELILKTVEFKTERISQKEFYTYLLNKAKLISLDLKEFPELERYIVYVSMYSVIDKSRIMDEMDTLENMVKDSFFRNDTERELARLSKNLALLRNIFNISLTREDYRYYKENEGSFSTERFLSFINTHAPPYNITARPDPSIGLLDTYRTNISRFYECSLKRDQAFMSNIRYKEPPPKNAIIVTGGFHTENLCKLFKEQNISYISLMPNFKNDDGYESPYFRLLAGEITGIQKRLYSVLSANPSLATMQIASIQSQLLALPVWGKANVDAFKAAVYINEQIETHHRVRVILDDGQLLYEGGEGSTLELSLGELMARLASPGGVRIEASGGARKSIVDNDVALDQQDIEKLIDIGNRIAPEAALERVNDRDINRHLVEYDAATELGGEIEAIFQKNGVEGAYNIVTPDGSVAYIFVRTAALAPDATAKEHELLEVYWRGRLEGARLPAGFDAQRTAHVLAWGQQIARHRWLRVSDCPFIERQLEKARDSIEQLQGIFMEDRTVHHTLLSAYLSPLDVDRVGQFEKGVSEYARHAVIEEELLDAMEQNNDRITFSDFMNISLYGRGGYYTSGKTKIGYMEKGGHYMTCPESMSPYFGTAIASQLFDMWKAMGEPSRFSVVEMGPGNGTLARDVLLFAGSQPGYEDFFKALRYILVDTSQALIERQRRVFDRFEEDAKTEYDAWNTQQQGLFDSFRAIGKDRFTQKMEFVMGSAIDELPEVENGVFLSNELIDVFPSHWVMRMGDSLMEKYVTYEYDVQGRLVFRERWGELSSPDIEAYVKSWVGAEENYIQAIEPHKEFPVNLEMARWQKSISRSLKRGYAITIDYHMPAGSTLGAFTSSGRPVMRAYSEGGLVHDDVYLRVPGTADLTTDVNFLMLERAGREAGLSTVGGRAIDQWEFLTSRGVPQSTADEEVGTFSVLIQAKGDAPSAIARASSGTQAAPAPGTTAATLQAMSPAEESFNSFLSANPDLNTSDIQKLRETIRGAPPEDARAILGFLDYLKNLRAALKDLLLNTNISEGEKFVFIPVSQKLSNATALQNALQAVLKETRDKLGDYRLNNITVIFYDGSIEMLDAKIAGYTAKGLKKENALIYIDGHTHADIKPYEQIAKNYYTVRDTVEREGEGYISIGGHVALGLGLLELLNKKEKKSPDLLEYYQLVRNLGQSLSYNGSGFKEFGTDMTAVDSFIDTLKRGDLKILLPPIGKVDIDKHMKEFVATEIAVLKSL